MKKTIITLLLAVAFTVAKAQQKKDSTQQPMIAIVLDTTTYKQLLYTIEVSIDSKSTTRAIIELLQKNARLIEGEKPKNINKGKRE